MRAEGVANQKLQPSYLVGAAAGALAGVVRTGIERQIGPQENPLVQVALDAVAGATAAPLLVLSKCLAFPMLDWSDIPVIIHLGVCAAAGGSSGFTYGPIAIAGAVAARVANQK